MIGFADDQVPVGKTVLGSYSVVARPENIADLEFDRFVVAIGNNRVRAGIFDKLRQSHDPLTLIHPFTHVSPEARIGAGSVVLPGAVISFGAVIGEDCIIGSHVHIDHETVIGAHCHIRNGSSIGSNCIIDPFCLTETGYAMPSFSQLSAE